MATIYTRATKGSALTWTEGDANITNLNNDKMEKSAPVLAGNLDVATYSITTSTTNGDIVIQPNGTGDLHVITDALRIGDLNAEARISTYGTGNLVLTTNEGHDPDPTITIGNGDNANITLLPSGTGSIVLDGLNWPQADGTNGQALTTNGSGQLSFTTISGGASTLNDLTDVTISSPGADQILKYDTLTNQWINGTAPTPSIALDGLSDVTTTTPSNGQALIYNGTTYQWENQTISSGGIGNVVEDTTPQLGGNLDVNGQQIVSVSNGNIVLAPDGSGVIRADKSVQIQAQGELRLSDSDSSNYVGFKSPATVSSNKVWTLPSADGTNGQVLSTNGSGTLAWATAGGGGPSFAILESSGHNVQVNANTSGTLTPTWTEILDASSIVTNTSTDFTLAAGTYLIEFSSTGMLASGSSGGTGWISAGGIYFDLYSTTASSILDRYYQEGARLYSGSSSTMEVPMGPVYLKVEVTPSVSTTYQIRYNNTGFAKQFNANASPGKAFRIVITKIA